MIIKQIIEKSSALEAHEKREATEERFEVVFYTDEAEKWISVLQSVLDAPLKVVGEKPTKEHLAITDDFGSIYSNQTLFKKEFEDHAVIAMFWPWQDARFTTLKVFKV